MKAILHRHRAAMLALAALTAVPAAADPNFIATPLIDFARGETYKGHLGRLYPGERNDLNGAHLAAGLKEALRIEPLDPNGQPSGSGKIVLLTIGMSNTFQESNAFITVVGGFGDRNPALKVVNGAQGGQTAEIIQDPNALYWTTVDTRLSSAGVKPAQVQAVWYKQADANPQLGFPDHAIKFRDESLRVMQIIKTRYPNTRIVYLSSRIYGGYAGGPLNPEPYAYEYGFAIRWLIEQQMAGDPNLNFDPHRGPVRSPLLQWGAYLWADGDRPRSDGLVWLREDFGSDGTHPSTQGADKVANLLLCSFSTNPTSQLWFLKPALQQLLGDLNGDRLINFGDIDAFVLALGDPEAYKRHYPNLDPLRGGDINQDGRLDFGDINPFVELLRIY